MNKWFIILFVLVCIGLMYGRFEGLTKLQKTQAQAVGQGERKLGTSGK